MVTPGSRRLAAETGDALIGEDASLLSVSSVPQRELPHASYCLYQSPQTCLGGLCPPDLFLLAATLLFVHPFPLSL